MALTLCSLASGSKGNAIYITDGETKLLVDCGITPCALKRALAAIGVNMTELDAVVVTHEHTDHAAYLDKVSEFARVYAHERCACAIMDRYARKGIRFDIYTPENYECGFSIGSIDVQPFRLPHDAVYPLGYSFMQGGAKLTIATDLGCPSGGVLNNIRGSDLLFLEANHDTNMLLQGDYPKYLKMRIMSSHGHLSNDTAAYVLTSTMDAKLKTVILGHLSEHNNTPQCARETVERSLLRFGVKPNEDIMLDVATQGIVTACYDTDGGKRAVAVGKTGA